MTDDQLNEGVNRRLNRLINYYWFSATLQKIRLRNLGLTSSCWFGQRKKREGGIVLGRSFLATATTANNFLNRQHLHLIH